MINGHPVVRTHPITDEWRSKLINHFPEGFLASMLKSLIVFLTFGAITLHFESNSKCQLKELKGR